MQSPLTPALIAYQDDWTAYGAVLDDIAARLARLDPSTVWAIEGTSGNAIGQVTLPDFARKFAGISWTLTDRDYSGINGGVGEVVSRFAGGVWQDAAEEIRAADFAIYMSWPDREGAVYLALHETAHTTELGLSMNNWLFDQFVHLGGDPRRYAASSQWTYNEAVANQIAATVAGALGLASIPNPSGGFPAAINRIRMV